MSQSIFEEPQVYEVPTQRGDRGVDVQAVQQSLAYKYPISIDGDFGPTTERLLKEFQVSAGLTPTGVVDSVTAKALAKYPAKYIANLGDLIMLDPMIYMGPSNPSSSKARALIEIYRRYGHILKQADRFDLRFLMSIMVLECGPEPTSLVNGQHRPIIRFENHLWWDYWGKYNPTQFSKRWAYSTSKRWEGHTFDGKPFHGSQPLEWASYEAAASVDLDAATKSISIGLGQLLGSHYKRLYFASPADMLAVLHSPGAQVLSMLDYLTSDYKLIKAVLDRDLRTFTSLYNGPGKVDEYSGILQSIYDIAKSLQF